MCRLDSANLPHELQPDSTHHHDVVLQLPAAYDQLQVGRGAETVLQRGAAVVYHVFHREVIRRGPTLIVFIPRSEGRNRGADLRGYTSAAASAFSAGGTHLSALVTRYTSVNSWRLEEKPEVQSEKNQISFGK